MTRCSVLCVAKEGISPPDRINFQNGNKSQITKYQEFLWKQYLLKIHLISISQLRLLIYIELNQYWAVVWWDQFPGVEVCHWTWHRGTSVPNPPLNFKWAWTSLFFTRPPHSCRPQIRVTCFLCDHTQDSTTREWDSDGSAIALPLINPIIHQLPHQSKYPLPCHSSRCFGH